MWSVDCRRPVPFHGYSYPGYGKGQTSSLQYKDIVSWFNIQKGDSLEERIGNASRVIGNFFSQRISLVDARRNLEFHYGRANNRQDLLKLAPFDFKLEALFAGSFGGMNGFKDSKSSIHLKDFVTIGMHKIDTADMATDLTPEFIKTAIFNEVKVITILSGADWVQVFKEYTDWAISIMIIQYFYVACFYIIMMSTSRVQQPIQVLYGYTSLNVFSA